MNNILTVSEHQKILVSQKRDIKNNTISYEDKKLLFDVTYQEKKGKVRYIVSRSGNRGDEIQVNSIVGSVSLKTGLTLEILPKFAKNNLDEESIKQHRKMLLNILRVSNEKNFISSASQSSKLVADEMPLLHYVIELFSVELLHTLRSWTYATYIKKVENSSFIRGKILISKSIQNNIIDKSKVYHSYQTHSSNNLLMQIFRSLSKLLLNDNNLSYKAKQTLHEVYLLLDEVDIMPLKKEDFKSMIFNRLNDKFEILFTQAEFIFNQYMPFTSHINSTPFWAILFDMNYLFEKFCAYLLRQSNIETQEQSIIKCFRNEEKTVSAKPDFILSQENNIIVADAKWKLLSKDKPIYGLDAQNFWQLFSYMNLVSLNEQVNGYFIVPKNNDDFEDEIIFTPIEEGNKSISILSIDFSLDFEELIQKYRFEVVDGVLKLKVKVIEEKIETPKIVKEIEVQILQEKEIEEDFQFNLEDFINELETLYHNKNIRKKLSPNRRNNKFKNLYYLKKFNELNTNNFKLIVNNNLNILIGVFEDLEINNIPENITKFKNIEILNLMNNNILVLENYLFKLSKLKILSISQNKITIIPNEILKLELLKSLLIDKKIVKENVNILQKLRSNSVEIYDENNDNLSEYIQSLLPKPKVIEEKPKKINKYDNSTLEDYKKLNYDRELELKYAKDTSERFYNIRKYISSTTNDLEVLNELSKYRIDEEILENISFKTHNNSKFKNSVKNNNTIYTTETIDRIARYEEYYDKNNTNSLIHQVASSYRLTLETREYLFETYKNDKNILEQLNNNSLGIFKLYDFQNKLLKELSDNLDNNRDIFNSIDINPNKKKDAKKLIPKSNLKSLKNNIAKEKIVKKTGQNNRNNEHDEDYTLALESFNSREFKDALEYLEESKISNNIKNKLEERIYKEIGKPFNDIREELLIIKQIFNHEHRTDIKKYIKELKLQDYSNLKFIILKLTTQEINSLTFILTYIENVNNDKEVYIKTINEFYKIVENSLINISKEQNKTLENNVLAWKDLDTDLIWEVNKKKSYFKYTSAKDILKKLNSQEYAGFKDWRLPTIDELKSLISDNPFHESYIKKPLNSEMNNLYWTNRSNSNNISMINFKTKREENVKSGYHASFICVRGKINI